MQRIGVVVAVTLIAVLFGGCARSAPLTASDFVDVPTLLEGTWEGNINLVRQSHVTPVVLAIDMIANSDGSRLQVMFGDSRLGTLPVSHEIDTEGNSSVVLSFRMAAGHSAKLRLFGRDNLMGIWRSAGSSSIVAGTEDRITVERVRPSQDPTDPRHPLLGVWEGMLGPTRVMLRIDPQGEALRVMFGTRSGVGVVQHTTIMFTSSGPLLEYQNKDGLATLTLTGADRLSGTWLSASDKRTIGFRLDRLR